MSRIGKQVIKTKKTVSVEKSPDGSSITVKGPKGVLSVPFDENFSLEILPDGVSISINNTGDNRKAKSLGAFHGLYSSLLKNAVTGVTDGFTKTLEIIGVGYKTQLQGKKLVLNMGFSHQVEFVPPDGIELQVPVQTTVVVSGMDKQLVGQVAANIRKIRKPEPYKGKGIRYSSEVVRRKAGKTGKK